ncbi:hypothetical protein T484DRAFT_1656405, partial [Baffinella frigidus]
PPPSRRKHHAPEHPWRLHGSPPPWRQDPAQDPSHASRTPHAGHPHPPRHVPSHPPEPGQSPWRSSWRKLHGGSCP